jgi:rfaE bifunctional protein kinase chain/domain
MSSTTDLFEQFNKLNILIIGDVMIDRYLEGKVSRISPEAPVPVVNLQSRESRLGGAANVALNIKALGATPYLCSIIGKDENGQEFLDLLPENQLPSKGIIQSKNRITTVKTRVIASSQHLLRVDQEDSSFIGQEDEALLLKKIKELLDQKTIHAILFQDYNKGVLTDTVIKAVILEALKKDIPTAVDPKNHNFWSYKHVDLFKPNLKEIRDQIPQANIQPSLEPLQFAAKKIKAELGNKYTLITLSEHGIFLNAGQDSVILPTQPRQIADVCGAGDTVISVSTLGLALGIDMKKVALLANLAGGQVCERVGVVPVDKAQLEREYQSLEAIN